jgi:hypothetical protein
MRETIDYGAERSWWAEGDHPLDGRELERVRAALAPGEAVALFARGRLDGRSLVWAVTAERLVEVRMGWFGRHEALPLASVTAIEVEEGAHGWTIRVAAAGGRRTLIAVAPSLGRPLVRRLEEVSGSAVSFMASRRAGTTRLFVSHMRGAPASVPAPTGPSEATRAPSDHTAASLTAALREAAELHRSGALSDEEFAAVKRRLLHG